MSLILPSYQSGFAPRNYEPAYPSIWQGCVAAYAPLLGPTGLVLRDSVGKNDGVLTGGPTWDISGGRYALGFDGVNDYVEVPDRSPLNFTNALTVSVWVYPRANLYQFVQSKRNANLADPPYSIARFTSNNAFFLVTNSNVNYKTVFSSTNSVPTNSWTHIVGTFNGSADTRIYINAKLDVASTDSGGVAFSQVQTLASPVLLGKYETISANFSFNGLIDDCRFYNRALSESEIKLLSTRRGIAYEPRPRRKWYFRGFSPKKKLLEAKITSTIPGSYQTGYAPRDGEPVYPELWKNCVGAWSAGLGATGGILRDQSGLDNHGTLTNMDPGTDWVINNGSYALDFDGVNDEVRATAPKITDAYCVSVWVKATAGAGSGFVSLSQDINNLGADLYMNANGTIVFYCPSTDSGSVRSFFTTTNSITSNQWVHVVGRWKASSINDIYVNGVLAAGTLTGSIQATLTTRTILSLGSRQGVNSWLTGQLDDARCYNRLLSESEIKLLASQRNIAYAHRKKNIAFRAYDPIKQVGVGKITSIIPGGYHTGVGGLNNEPAYPELTRGLVGGWCPSLGVTGGILRDNSGQGNHGTLTNGPTWQISGGKYALDFDGVDDFINYGTQIPLGGATRISFSAWVWRSVAGQMLVFNRYVNTGALGVDRRGDSFGINTVNANGTVSLYVQTQNTLGYIGFDSTIAITGSQWNHIAATCVIAGANSIGKTYINGIEVPNTFTAVGTLPTAFEPNVSTAPYTTCRYIGGSGTSAFNSGIADDIRAYNRILSPSEIRLLASRRGIGYDFKSHRSYSKTQSSGLLKRLILTGQT